MSEPIKAVFFDWDHTVWDFEANSALTLQALYHRYRLAELGSFSSGDFIVAHSRVNHEVWHLANAGIIPREATRHRKFEKVLALLGVPEHAVPPGIHDDYINECPRQSNLMPGAAELLPLLAAKYDLYIITNGFPDIQEVKVAHSGVAHLFKALITARQSGWMKPERKMFEYAQALAGIAAGECMMVGDSYLADVAGAVNAGWQAVWLNPEKEIVAELPPQVRQISSFHELSFLL